MKFGKTFFSAFSIVYFFNWLVESLVQVESRIFLTTILSCVVIGYILSCVTIRIHGGKIKGNERKITNLHAVMMFVLVSSLGILAFMPVLNGNATLLDRLLFIRINIFFLPELFFYLVILMNLQYSTFELIMVLRHVESGYVPMEGRKTLVSKPLQEKAV